MDLTVAATPGYFATMGAEAVYLRKRAERLGPSAADYTRDDTIASLSMGVLSLLAPIVMPKLLKPFVPGKGKLGKALLADRGRRGRRHDDRRRGRAAGGTVHR